ncbi:MAG TPA: insulinase family protein, partial [Stellaceae bacterium]|nr:insulinase family protein [Stellaceae bacterium]
MTRFIALLLIAVPLALLGSSPADAVTIEKVESPGGIIAWLVEDHSVPVVSTSIAFRGGAALDPDDKAGLAEFTADLLDEGAGELDSTAYQSKLEDLAASLDFNVDQDNISARLRTLSANLAPTYDLLHLALTEPRFDAAPVARLRAELLDAIKRDLHQPEALAYRLWMKSSFAGSPYARSTRGTAQSIAAI